MMTTALPTRLNPFREFDARVWSLAILKGVALPVVGIGMFLLIWHLVSGSIQTSLGQFPGPVQVQEQVKNLYVEFLEEKQREVEFYERQQKRIDARLKVEPDFKAEIRPYTGKPTFVQQIFTSLVTVFSGFFLAALVAIPLGIAIGLSASLYTAVNPVIQLFKPVSPLAWLPLVTMVVSALYTTADGSLPKSFVTSAITVMLCCIWPTVINTAVGVTSVSKDLLNVSCVLRLNWIEHIQKIVLPSAVPMIFTGLRLSLSTAWMVLIAAEMLAQNPGLGKFVWDEFQNGSSNSLGRIMVAVLTIGLIGFLLDRSMLWLQRRVSWDKNAITR
ncbi:MAG: ABC transporter permease [Gammaproteobacteria bacterium]|nr:ABC transporter permease [Gammaproteobacteria bacterium]